MGRAIIGALTKVPGIVEGTGFGGPARFYQVELDLGRLQALGVTQEQVANAIARSNGSKGGSFTIQNYQNFMVCGLGLLRTVEDIRAIVIVGGLLPATALTLLFLPALCRWFSGKVKQHRD